MFEETEPKADKDSRSRILMFGSAAAVLVVIVLVVVIGSRTSRPVAGEVNMAVAGTPDFESYASFVQIDMSDKDDKWT
ncbi:MAG TPA: hypothetical protein VFV34_21695, partial [Blastocatellia bacterium]|nr:hypothetical protein [Blastocatellia bacterium]